MWIVFDPDMPESVTAFDQASQFIDRVVTSRASSNGPSGMT